MQLATWRQASFGVGPEGRAASAASFAQVIQHWYRVGNWSSFEVSVRMCVEALAGTVHDEAAAHLAGWLLRGDRGTDALVGGGDRFTGALATLRDRLGSDPVDKLLRDGQMLDATDVAALCRGRLGVVDVDAAEQTAAVVGE